jgi:hypothetical protein
MPGLMRCLASIEQSLRHSWRGCGDEQQCCSPVTLPWLIESWRIPEGALRRCQSRDPKAAAAAAAR